jgi:hypothetical protein
MHDALFFTTQKLGQKQNANFPSQPPFKKYFLEN